MSIKFLILPIIAVMCANLFIIDKIKNYDFGYVSAVITICSSLIYLGIVVNGLMNKKQRDCVKIDKNADS